MRTGTFVTSLFVGSLSLVVACSSTASGPEGGSSGSSGTAANGNPTGDGGPTSDAATEGSPSGTPEASKVEAPVDIDGTCTPAKACGGSLSGTYDYERGCIADAFASARKSCPSIDTSGAKVVVKGSLTFSGNALTRAVTSTVSGSVVVPASCSSGQCSLVESALKGAFDSVTCSGSSACTCTISSTTTTKNATTFTTSGSVVTTADGDTYSYCIEGGKLTYEGKAAAAEDGVWSLTKR